MELLNQITVLGGSTLPLEDPSENFRLVVCMRFERLFILRENAGVAIVELRRDTERCLQTH